MGFVTRIRNLGRRDVVDAEIALELRAHLEMAVEAAVRKGMSEQQARRAARLQFGNPVAVRETTMGADAALGLDAMVRDVRYAMRTLTRTPGFSLVAIAVMALCIGASTSLFTVVRSVLLRPLPFRDPDHLVMVFERFRVSGPNPTSIVGGAVAPGDYFDWRAQTHGFEDMAAWNWWGFNLTGEKGEMPEEIRAAGATWNLFSVLGVQPAFGRAFTEAEDRQGSSAAMLTWSLFKRRFGGDPGIVGRQIHLDGKPYTVVGVLPQSFAYPVARVQVWVPYQSVVPAQYLHHHAYHMTYVVARMRPGVSLASAVSAIGAVQYRLHTQYPDQAVSEGVTPRSLNDDLARDVKEPLMVLMSAVTCMLMIGCLNVANLLVARGAARQKEVAIRSALGARRLTLIRQQLTESVLISVSGGVLGVLVSLAATAWMARVWKDLPSAAGIHVDGTVLAFACAMVIVSALLAGLLPAISSTGRAVLGALQASSRTMGGSVSRTALRKALLATEIAVTVVLLVAAGLLLKSFVRMRSTDIGCATDNVLTMSYNLSGAQYDTPQKVLAFHEALLDRVRAIPGVRAAGLGFTLPGAGVGEDDVFTIPEHPRRQGDAAQTRGLVRWADPEYFHTLEIPLLSGRFFTRDDGMDRARKVIISREMARQYFPGENPLGRHIEVPLWDNTQYEIVGVVGDTLHQVNEPTEATIYLPSLAGDMGGLTLVVRTAADPLAFSVPIQKQFAALDPELPVSDVLTMQQVIGQSMENARFSATLVVFFAALSLALACVGLYGVLAYLMTQRTTELGIRIALGAPRERVLLLLLFDGLRPALAGLAMGLIAGATVTKAIQSMLYGTKPLDPVVFCAVSAMLLVVSMLACLAPAWRASRVDPMQALRSE